MFEKVNPSHPDKIADRIAGALVDYAYTKDDNPKIAVEVLIGHGEASIIAESSVDIPVSVAESVVSRIAGDSLSTRLLLVPQDVELARNQAQGLKAGDNGIFSGRPISHHEEVLTVIVKRLYEIFPSDGKFIYSTKDGNSLIIACQSHASEDDLRVEIERIIAEEKLNIVRPNIVVNPLGYWTGGTGVDTGATNRKLGSDMGGAVTGGGLHGKDLSKADVSVNIWLHIVANHSDGKKRPANASCAIGDEDINDVPYSIIVATARAYIDSVGGFEKFAEWGLIR